MNKFQAVEIAARTIEAAGFVREALSNLSEALYFRFPGRRGLLRVAAHACRHPFDIVTTLTFEYREAWQRDEDTTGLLEEEVVAMAREAIEEYLAEAEEEEEGAADD